METLIFMIISFALFFIAGYSIGQSRGKQKEIERGLNRQIEAIERKVFLKEKRPDEY